jgi:hypothetical protein
MKRKTTSWRAALAALLVLVAGFAGASAAVAQPGREALAGFDQYVGRVEARLDAQHRSGGSFLTSLPAQSSLAGGNIALQQLTPDGGAELPGALLHHWRGTAFVPGATAAQFEGLLRNFIAYPDVFAPQVVQASVLPDGEVKMRVVQKHVITVVLDTTYAVTFGALDPLHRYSASKSTHVSEIENAGTARERALSPAEAHGFLWRLNTYWSYEQRDGGLYLQIETVSLTRGIPAGLGWAVRPFIESVPRESLAFTLHAASNALRHEGKTGRAQ